MEVRIAYATDLDNIPDKVEEMLGEIEIRKPNQMVSLEMEMLDLGYNEMASTLIEEARRALAKADRGLAEAQMILGGYIEAKKEPETEESDVADSTGEPDVD